MTGHSYLLGSIVAVLCWCAWAVHTAYRLRTKEPSNLKKIGMRLNWLMLDPRWKDTTRAQGAPFLLGFAAITLVANFVFSWLAVLVWAISFAGAGFIDFKDRKEFKDARRRLSHEDLSKEEVIEVMCVLNRIEGDAKKAFVAKVEAELGNEGTERKAA